MVTELQRSVLSFVRQWKPLENKTYSWTLLWGQTKDKECLRRQKLLDLLFI